MKAAYNYGRGIGHSSPLSDEYNQISNQGALGLNSNNYVAHGVLASQKQRNINYTDGQYQTSVLSAGAQVQYGHRNLGNSNIDSKLNSLPKYSSKA